MHHGRLHFHLGEGIGEGPGLSEGTACPGFGGASGPLPTPPTWDKLQKIASEKEAWNFLLTPAATATHPWVSRGKWMDESQCCVIQRIIDNRIIFTLTKLRDLGGNIKMFNEEQ